jgi:hypothetical protein
MNFSSIVASKFNIKLKSTKTLKLKGDKIPVGKTCFSLQALGIRESRVAINNQGTRLWYIGAICFLITQKIKKFIFRRFGCLCPFSNSKDVRI